jgi:hypothetical protein
MPQPIFHPGQLRKEGGENREDQEKGYDKRSCQTAGSNVLGNDEGC